MSPSVLQTEDGDAGLAEKIIPLPPDITASLKQSAPGPSPSLWHQAIRLVLFLIWFTMTCVTIVATQFIGAPLAFYDKNVFYAYYRCGLSDERYIANTKKSFGVTVTTITQWYYHLLKGLVLTPTGLHRLRLSSVEMRV
jgi:hypothetical protein